MKDNASTTSIFIKQKPLYEQHYRSLQAVVFVVDSNDRQNMDQARDELHILMGKFLVEEQVLTNEMFCLFVWAV